MSIQIDEVVASVEATPSTTDGGTRGSAGQAGLATEARIEELRPLVRALVAEEIERWLRSRGVMP